MGGTEQAEPLLFSRTELGAQRRFVVRFTLGAAGDLGKIRQIGKKSRHRTTLHLFILSLLDELRQS